MTGPLPPKPLTRIVFALVFLTGAWFVQGGSWAVNARFDLTRAIVEKGTLDCSAYNRNSGDMVQWKGRWIPYKAPGLSILGAPAWALLYWGSAGEIASTKEGLTWGAWFVNLFATLLPLAWAATWFFRLAFRLAGNRAAPALWATAAAFMGTLLLPLSTLYLGHATAAALLWVAFVFALGEIPGAEKKGAWIGALLGLSVLVEYLALPAAAAVGLLALSRGGKTRWKGMLAGALPPLLLLAAYHWALLGAPWRTPYSKPPEMFATKGAAAGIFVSPSLHVLWETTFGPYRGLFFSSPVLLAGLPGFVPAWRKGLKAPVLVSLFVAAYHFLFLWVFNGWYGGWTCGVRYFTPAILFLAWPLALVLDRAKGAVPVLVKALSVLSAVMMLAATAVNPQVPSGNPAAGRPRPWIDYLVPAFFSGDLADQVQSVDDRRPDDAAHIVYWPWGRKLLIRDPVLRKEFDRKFPPAVYNPRNPAVKGGATNLGLLLGLPGLLSLLPLLAAWAVLLLFFFRRQASALTSSPPPGSAPRKDPSRRIR